MTFNPPHALALSEAARSRDNRTDRGAESGQAYELSDLNYDAEQHGSTRESNAPSSETVQPPETAQPSETAVSPDVAQPSETAPPSGTTQTPRGTQPSETVLPSETAQLSDTTQLFEAVLLSGAAGPSRLPVPTQAGPSHQASSITLDNDGPHIRFEDLVRSSDSTAVPDDTTAPQGGTTRRRREPIKPRGRDKCPCWGCCVSFFTCSWFRRERNAQAQPTVAPQSILLPSSGQPPIGQAPPVLPQTVHVSPIRSLSVHPQTVQSPPVQSQTVQPPPVQLASVIPSPDQSLSDQPPTTQQPTVESATVQPPPAQSPPVPLPPAYSPPTQLVPALQLSSLSGPPFSPPPQPSQAQGQTPLQPAIAPALAFPRKPWYKTLADMF